MGDSKAATGMRRPPRFAGRAALVTGAGGGMGLQIARDLAAEGCAVAGLDLKPQPQGFPAEGLYLEGDVSDAATVEDAVRQVEGRFARLDHLVNAAAVLWFDRDRSLAEVDLEVWRRVLDINLTAMALTVRAALPLLRTGGGSMLHLSSIQALRGDDRPQDAYQAAKAAVIALSKSLAIQLAPDGIRSNVLVPGLTESPMQARWHDTPEQKARTAAAVPLGRVGTPRDMANAALFLLSDEVAWITGTELVVDDGLLARP